jgi:type IV secretion system protein VirB11
MSEVEAAKNITRHMLQPVQNILNHPDLTDFHINGPGEGRAFVDVGYGMKQITLPYTLRDLQDLALYAAAITRQDITESTPLVGTAFPDGERIQIILPPAAPDGCVYFSLRKPRPGTDTPAELRAKGVFAQARHSGRFVSNSELELRRLNASGQTEELLKLAVSSGLNTVFSGEVGTGKTHVMRTYASCIPYDSRIVTIEDMHELIDMVQPNVVHTFYSKGGQSIAKISAEELVENSMRLGMDWLLNQELRDRAAYAYLDVLDSGHKVMTSCHAESAASTRSRIKGLIKKHPSGQHMKDEEIMASLYRGIDLIVHCKKEKDPETGKWRRFIDEVLYDPDEKLKYADVPSPFKDREKEYA